MNYIQVTFRTDQVEEFANDLLAAFLGEIGFDSFEENGRGLIGYCPENLFSIDEVKQVINSLPIENPKLIQYRTELIEDKNWNSVWEQNEYQPIEISEECIIHPSNKKPAQSYRYDIIINPVQAFGTGYHETTRLILRKLMRYDLSGYNVLDMGTGTAILAIMASMRNAKHIVAIDIDEWSKLNAIENVKLNNIENITVELGDASLLCNYQENFDLVLANINRNILLNDMSEYVSTMKSGATLLMSGFYSEDLQIIQEKAAELGLNYVEHITDNNWVVAEFKL
ncbi:MAG: 50S ribosomal protein L11 methyltransferase [bacterium]